MYISLDIIKAALFILSIIGLILWRTFVDKSDDGIAFGIDLGYVLFWVVILWLWT